MRVALFPLCVLLFISANSQQVLTPSAKAFEKKWVKSTTHKMLWYAVKDTTLYEIGNTTTQVEVGKEHITVITRVAMKNSNAPWVDSTVADALTLAPVKHSSYNRQRDMVLNFGPVVTGFYKDKAKNTVTAINDTTTTPYFDSNIYPTLLGWLPLTNGYRQQIAIYDYNPYGKTGILKASVTGITDGVYKSAKKGMRDVWVVTVTDELGGGGDSVTTYYFDKEDRALWKLEINAGGRKMLMLLEE